MGTHNIETPRDTKRLKEPIAKGPNEPFSAELALDDHYFDLQTKEMGTSNCDAIRVCRSDFIIFDTCRAKEKSPGFTQMSMTLILKSQRCSSCLGAQSPK